MILHPGNILRRRYLEPLNITAQELANAMGVSKSIVSRILNQKVSVTADMALRLAHVLSTTPELWVNLQSQYDLAVSRSTVCLDGLTKLNTTLSSDEH